MELSSEPSSSALKSDLGISGSVPVPSLSLKRGGSSSRGGTTTLNRYPSRSASAAVSSTKPPPAPPVPIFAGSSTTSPHAALKWCAANSACREGRARHRPSVFSSSDSVPWIPAPLFRGLGLRARRCAGDRAGEPKANARSGSALSPPSSPSPPRSSAPVSRTPPLSRSCDCARGRAKVCAKRKSIRSCTNTKASASPSSRASPPPPGGASSGSVARSVAITTFVASRERSRHRARSSAATAGRPPTGTAAAKRRRCVGTSAAGVSAVGATRDAGNAPNSKGSRRSSTNASSSSVFGVCAYASADASRRTASSAPLARRSASFRDSGTRFFGRTRATRCRGGDGETAGERETSARRARDEDVSGRSSARAPVTRSVGLDRVPRRSRPAESGRSWCPRSTVDLKKTRARIRTRPSPRGDPRPSLGVPREGRVAYLGASSRRAVRSAGADVVTRAPVCAREGRRRS